LEHTVLQQADHLQRHQLVGRVADRQLRANTFQMQTVDGRCGIDDHRHDRFAFAIIAEPGLEQGPWILRG
jgi:hypothetical protein